MSDSEEQRKRAEKEVIRQEQFWFAATSLAFIGFIGALLKTPSFWDACISLALIWVLTTFTVYLVVGRHKRYCEIIDPKYALYSWRKALCHAVQDRSGALYCIVLVTFAAIGFTLIIFMRYLTPIPPAQAATPQTMPASSPSVVAPVTIPLSATSAPTQKP